MVWCGVVGARATNCLHALSESLHKLPELLTQKFVRVEDGEKGEEARLAALSSLLRADKQQAIVFCNTGAKCEVVAKALRDMRIRGE